MVGLWLWLVISLRVLPVPADERKALTARSQERLIGMAQTYDLILRGGTVVNHDGEAVRDLGIAAGRIAALGDLSQASAGETVDCRGLHILPGVIDTQGSLARG